MLDIEIVTPKKVIYSGTANMVQVPGSKSPFQILNNHVPIVSNLVEGILRIQKQDNSEISFNITSGVVELNNNKVSVIVESAVEN
jgi:F-type H+-transporting ATPase subunit epsilon